MTGSPADVLGTAVEEGDLPCVVGVAAVARGAVLHWAAGPATPGELDTTEPVGPDTLFRLASMTKIITTVAALQLRERGELELDAPVERYCPGFADVRVLEGFDGDVPQLRPPASRATVRQLLTHTNGLAYGFWSPDLARWDTVAHPTDLAQTPLVCDPGTRFEYGLGTDWLGRVIEEVSGLGLDEYLTRHILDPLRMSATTFAPGNDQLSRCVPVHVRQTDGIWRATDFEWSRRPSRWPGGHGLYSTPRDFLRFQRMLLGAGTLDEATILTPGSVREMFTNQIDDLDFPSLMRTVDPTWSADIAAEPGHKWGFGLRLSMSDTPDGRVAGSGGWLGLFNTYFWIDPTSGVAGAFFTQLRPLGEASVLRAFRAFERSVYATCAPRTAARPDRRPVGAR